MLITGITCALWSMLGFITLIVIVGGVVGIGGFAATATTSAISTLNGIVHETSNHQSYIMEMPSN